MPFGLGRRVGGFGKAAAEPPELYNGLSAAFAERLRDAGCGGQRALREACGCVQKQVENRRTHTRVVHVK